MIIQTLPTQNAIPQDPHITTATPLTAKAFAPFGAAVSNPAPDQLPHNTAPSAVATTLPCDAKSANQGSAIQYRDLGAVRNLYRNPNAVATPRLTMFVCGARELQRQRPQQVGDGDGDGDGGRGSGGEGSLFFEVKILERHPFTTQTFCPLGVDPSGPRRYLVIVAPTLPLPPSPPQDSNSKESGEDALLRQEHGQGGLPDIRNLRAFVATGNQAVTYGAGTWHAPMVALGPAGTAVDFVVTQFANGVDVEDCQEVVLKRRDDGDVDVNVDVDDESSGVWVRIIANEEEEVGVSDGVGDGDDNTLSSRPTKL